MTPDTRRSEAGRDYNEAQDARYGDKNLREALILYVRLIAAHPDSPEAEFSRTQIDNIVRQLVPQDSLSEAHIGMALAQLDANDAGTGREESSRN